MAAEVKPSSSMSPGQQIKISKKKQALFVLLIFVVFIFLLEGALRLLGIARDVPELRETAGLYRREENSIGFEYTPGWSGFHAGAMVQINSAGWRGKDFSTSKPQGIIRILGVGDSFTFGRAVDDEDIFLTKLQQVLNSEGSYVYETINAGHENVNTVKELEYMKEREVMRLEPDVVVLGFTVHNDAQGKKNRAQYREFKRTGSLPLKIAGSEWFKDLADTFRLARIFRSGVMGLYNKELTEVYYKIILDNYAEGSKTWEDCRKALIGIYELCRENNKPLVFVLFPVYTKELTQTYRDYPEDFKLVHERLKSVLSGKEGVVIVDMLDDLTATGLTINELRVAIDGHPNAVWHQVVAHRLALQIKGMELNPHNNRDVKSR